MICFDIVNNHVLMLFLNIITFENMLKRKQYLLFIDQKGMVLTVPLQTLWL